MLQFIEPGKFSNKGLFLNQFTNLEREGQVRKKDAGRRKCSLRKTFSLVGLYNVFLVSYGKHTLVLFSAAVTAFADCWLSMDKNDNDIFLASLRALLFFCCAFFPLLLKRASALFLWFSLVGNFSFGGGGSSVVAIICVVMFVFFLVVSCLLFFNQYCIVFSLSCTLFSQCLFV